MTTGLTAVHLPNWHPSNGQEPTSTLGSLGGSGMGVKGATYASLCGGGLGATAIAACCSGSNKARSRATSISLIIGASWGAPRLPECGESFRTSELSNLALSNAFGFVSLPPSNAPSSEEEALDA